MELISDEDRGRNGYNDDHETYVQVIAKGVAGFGCQRYIGFQIACPDEECIIKASVDEEEAGDHHCLLPICEKYLFPGNRSRGMEMYIPAAEDYALVLGANHRHVRYRALSL